MIKTAVFDMDGLLLDTERLSQRCWAEAGEHYGVPDFPAVSCRWIGSNMAFARQVFEEVYGKDRFPFDEIREEKMRYADWHIVEEGLPVKRGAVQLLSWLRENGVRVALASSTEKGKAARELKMTDLYGYFDLFVHGDEVRQAKPAPDIFLLAAERLGVEPGQCRVFEDSLNGVRAATAAGMPVYMVPDLVAPDDFAREHALGIYDDLGQILEELKREAGQE